jgi:hypothetical protein
MDNYLIIECTECNTAFRKQDIKETSPEVFCKCKNLSVGPKKVENSIYPFYAAATYSKTKPRIYELKGVDNQEEV